MRQLVPYFILSYLELNYILFLIWLSHLYESAGALFYVKHAETIYRSGCTETASRDSGSFDVSPRLKKSK